MSSTGPFTPVRGRVRTGAFLGLLLGTLWFLTEALWNWTLGPPLLHHRLGDGGLLALIELTLGVSAPLVIAIGALGAIAYPSWEALARRGELSRLLSLVHPADADARRRATALTLTLVADTAGVAACVFMAAPSIFQHIQTPALASGAIVIVALAGVALFLVLSAPFYAGARFIVGALANRGPLWQRLLAPGVVLLGVVGPSLVAGVTALLLLPGARLLPWTLLVAPVFATLLTTWVGIRLSSASTVLRQLTATAGLALMLAILLLLGLTAATMRPERRPELIAVVEVGGATALWFGFWSRITDVDNDGASSLYGGMDCEPWDENVHPLAVEVIDNGIDEDCSGVDLEAMPFVLEPGARVHPRPASVAARPNIILITTDSLSHRHTGLGGYERSVTPGLDAWASRAVVFDAAFSVTSSTATALPSLLTGRHPHELVYDENKIGTVHLSQDTDNLAAMLSRIGYATVAIPGAPLLVDWPGVTTPFDVVHTGPVERLRDLPAKAQHLASDQTDLAIRELETERDSPLFLWIHYYDHHEPYFVPKGEAPLGPEDIDRYDAELRYTDRHWTRLFTAIEARWAPSEVVTVFTADHGEAFDANHLAKRHHFSVYTEELHVPFIIQAAGPRGKRVRGLVGHLDLLPTIANLVPVCPQHALRGESLVGALFADVEPTKTALYSYLYAPTRDALETPLLAIGLRTDELYYARDLARDTAWMTSWREDPVASEDLRPQRSQEAEALAYLCSRMALEALGALK